MVQPVVATTHATHVRALCCGSALRPLKWAKWRSKFGPKSCSAATSNCSAPLKCVGCNARLRVHLQGGYREWSSNFISMIQPFSILSHFGPLPVSVSRTGIFVRSRRLASSEPWDHHKRCKKRLGSRLHALHGLKLSSLLQGATHPMAMYTSLHFPYVSRWFSVIFLAEGSS